MFATRRAALVAVALLLAPARPAAAQEPLTVTPGFDPTSWVGRSERVELRLNRPPTDADGRLAVFIGGIDATALFEIRGEVVRKRATGIDLPAGESELTLYAVSADEQWAVLSRTPLRVRAWAGFEEATLEPHAAVNNKGQVAEGHAPESNRPARERFQDIAVNLGLRSTHRRDGWSVRSQWNILGTSNRQETLRFGELQNEAPKLDLADYLIAVDGGRFEVTLGHHTFGSNRFLLNAMPSRGVAGALRVGATRLAVAALNGTSIVGWTNPLGPTRPDHRLLTSTLGLEVVPSRPGLVQIEAMLLSGSVQPGTGFNQAAITDAERSRGAGFRLLAQDPRQRLRVEAAFARSRFVNPPNGRLGADSLLTPLPTLSRNAHHVDLTLDVLRSVRPSHAGSSRLALTLRHERIAPLYRSVALQAPRADIEQNAIELNGGVGALSAQLGLGRASDNLDDVIGILKTRTRVTNASIALPVAAAFGAGAPAWLPMVSWGLSRTHQFADGAAEGFPAHFLPDQVAVNQTLTVQMTGPVWRAGAQLNRSKQDNRQRDRAAADLVNEVVTVSVDITPKPRIDLSADAAVERAENREFDQRTTTRRIGAHGTWRPNGSTVLGSGFTRTSMTDSPRTSRMTNTELRFELSQRVASPLNRASRAQGGQVFVRYTRTVGTNASLLGPNDERRSWALQTGVTLTLF